MEKLLTIIGKAAFIVYMVGLAYIAIRFALIAIAAY